jgi:hypothetical protein
MDPRNSIVPFFLNENLYEDLSEHELGIGYGRCTEEQSRW